MQRFSAARDECIAIGDNPATDLEGAQGMSLPCLLVGSDPGAHFQDLAGLMQSHGPPFGTGPCSRRPFAPAQI
jgi:hypothetical protein